MTDEVDTGGEELSLRDELSAAISSASEGDGAAPAATPVESKAAPSAEPAAAAPRADGRDASGRFAPKAGEPAPAAQTAPVALPGAATAQAPTDSTPRAPASWTATAKAEFLTLKPEVQAEIMRREREIEQGFSQQQSRLEVANRFDQLTEPWRERFAAEGIDAFQGVQRLFAAQQFLEKNPMQGLLYLARSYGVHPNQLAQAAGGQQAQQPQLPPEMRALVSKVQSLETQLSQRQQTEQTQRVQAVESEITTFAADPANTYFHNVKAHMIALLSNGQAKDLKDAYDQAVWANPETRQLIQADQSKKAEADRLAAQRASATGAKRAAGSVVGAPKAGSAPLNGAGSDRTLAEELRENLRASRA